LHVEIKSVGPSSPVAFQQATQYIASPPMVSQPRVYSTGSGRPVSPVRGRAASPVRVMPQSGRAASPIRVMSQAVAYQPQQPLPSYVLPPQQQQSLVLPNQPPPRVSISSSRPGACAVGTSTPVYVHHPPSSNVASYTAAPTTGSALMPPGYTPTPAPNSLASAAGPFASPVVTVRPPVSQPVTYNVPGGGHRTPLAPYVSGNTNSQYMLPGGAARYAPSATSIARGSSLLAEPMAGGIAYGQAPQVRSYMASGPRTGSAVITTGMTSSAPAGAPSAFDMIDRNHDGVITRQEFQQAIGK